MLGKALKYERKSREFDNMPLTVDARERAIDYATEDTKPMIPMTYVALFTDIIVILYFFS